MKVCPRCGEEICTRDGDNLCDSCERIDGEHDAKSKAQRSKARRQRRERDDILRSVGLVKVRGALGGTYWE